jgi:hypothetical protein
MALPAGTYQVTVKQSSTLDPNMINDWTVNVYAKDAVVIKNASGQAYLETAVYYDTKKPVIIGPAPSPVPTPTPAPAP